MFMPDLAAKLPPPVNHVFVDFENVHKVDLTIIGQKAVNFILLVGPKQTKVSVDLVEKLFEHALSVQLVRLAAPGRNALDFALAYYVGRAVVADPTGCFHIISKDTGYDPLIQHLRNNRIDARRHASFESIFVEGASVTLTDGEKTAVVSKTKTSPRTKAAKPSVLDARVIRIMEHFRRPSATRPRSQEKLVSFLVAHHGRKITELEALGVQLKDFERGLVDFPSLRDGRVVLLCWQLGEGDELEWWHDVDAGFAGRTPL